MEKGESGALCVFCWGELVRCSASSRLGHSSPQGPIPVTTHLTTGHSAMMPTVQLLQTTIRCHLPSRVQVTETQIVHFPHLALHFREFQPAYLLYYFILLLKAVITPSQPLACDTKTFHFTSWCIRTLYRGCMILIPYGDHCWGWLGVIRGTLIRGVT